MREQVAKAGMVFINQLLTSLRSNRLASRLTLGAMTVLILYGTGSGLAYFDNFLLARWMGVAGYGRYAYALAWPQILAPLATLGLSLGVLRFVPGYVKERNWSTLISLIRKSRALTLYVGVAIAFLGILISRLSSQSEGTFQAVAIGLMLTPLLGLVELHSQLLRARQSIHWAYGLSKLLQPFLFLLVITLLLLAEALSSNTVLLGFGLVLVLVLLLQSIHLRRTIPWAVTNPSTEVRTREWLVVSAPLLIVVAATLVQGKVDVLLVGLLRGEAEAGIYNIALTTSSLLGFFLLAVNGMGAPLISELHAAHDQEGIQKLFGLVSTGLLLVAVLGGGALILAGKPILSLFGEAYEGGYPVLVYLTIGNVVNLSAGPVGYLVNLTGFERQGAMVFGVSALMNIGLSLILINAIGNAGAAIATMATMVLWNVWLAILIRRKLAIETFIFLLPFFKRRNSAA